MQFNINNVKKHNIIAYDTDTRRANKKVKIMDSCTKDR